MREKEGQNEQLFGPVEDMYSMLNRYEVRVTKEEQDTVGELPYSWKKLKTLADSVGDGLVAMQDKFKKELMRNVKLFVADVDGLPQRLGGQRPHCAGHHAHAGP